MRAAALASGTADAQAFTGQCTLYGYAVRENAGTPAAASLVLRNGTTVTDPPVAFISLAAGGSQVVTLPAVDCTNGVFADRLSGTTELVLYVDE
jgi:hypothetical protein